MRKLALIAPLAAVMAVAAAAQAQPAEVTVSIGGDLDGKVETLGERDVQRQADRLAELVSRALSSNGALDGARVHLVLTDLKPNRPTFQQVSDRPGLSALESISIGGATIEGEVITADGRRLPVRLARYSHSLQDVQGYGTWQDADRAFSRLAANLATGRYVSR
jgi:hypothetical protein